MTKNLKNTTALLDQIFDGVMNASQGRAKLGALLVQAKDSEAAHREIKRARLMHGILTAQKSNAIDVGTYDRDALRAAADAIMAKDAYNPLLDDATKSPKGRKAIFAKMRTKDEQAIFGRVSTYLSQLRDEYVPERIAAKLERAKNRPQKPTKPETSPEAKPEDAQSELGGTVVPMGLEPRKLAAKVVATEDNIVYAQARLAMLKADREQSTALDPTLAKIIRDAITGLENYLTSH